MCFHSMLLDDVIVNERMPSFFFKLKIIYPLHRNQVHGNSIITALLCSDWHYNFEDYRENYFSYAVEVDYVT